MRQQRDSGENVCNTVINI